MVFNNTTVSQTNSQKQLGVTLDFKLTFEEHPLNVLKKVNKPQALAQVSEFVTKNNNNYYLHNFCQILPELWGYIIRPSISQFFA